MSLGDGRISPSGDVSVVGGASQTFTIIPDDGKYLHEIKVDDVVVDDTRYEVDEIVEYTFTNVQADHTILVTFGTPG